MFIINRRKMKTFYYFCFSASLFSLINILILYSLTNNLVLYEAVFISVLPVSYGYMLMWFFVLLVLKFIQRYILLHSNIKFWAPSFILALVSPFISLVYYYYYIHDVIIIPESFMDIILAIANLTGIYHSIILALLISLPLAVVFQYLFVNFLRN